MIRRGRRRDNSFLIRIWHEEERNPTWRASVMHLATRELRYFTTYNDLCTFLDRWTEPHKSDD